ncbi:uncharacterized protein LOC125049752 [Pieris napi]|uniref:uncharacterized protein LOC125049752 n=1 Tax=Pieris napi TaxID=78633 RepID=UPI001FBA533F|nr:uncharacterized protein LOC125049752 [Pieris napi]
MADIAREYLENSLENEYILNTNQENNRNEIETHDKVQESESNMTHSSSYVLARNDSQLSGDVDRWIGDSPTEVPLRGIRASGVQRSALISTQNSLLSNSFWYLAALVLPLFSTSSYSQWQCSPNAIYNSAGLLVAQLGRLCSHIRCQLRHMSENTHARDVFATAMDIILVVYAVGFLILSMYHASLIG